MKIIALAVMLSAVVATPVLAAGTYVGVNVGRNQTSYSGIDSSTGFGFLGGYSVGENIAVEATYNNLGDANIPGSTVKLSGSLITGAAVGSLPVTDELSLLGKLGYAISSVSTPGNSVSRGDIIYGIGAQYSVSKTVALRINYDFFKVGDGTITYPTKDSALMTVGAVFKL